MEGGKGGPGGPSPNLGGQGGLGGAPQFDPAAVKLTKELVGIGGAGGAGGQGGKQGGGGGLGETANLLLPLLTVEEIKWLGRKSLKEFCEEHQEELEDIYPMLKSQGYRTVAAVANASRTTLKDTCGLGVGHIDELKTAMQAWVVKAQEAAGAPPPMANTKTKKKMLGKKMSR